MGATARSSSDFLAADGALLIPAFSKGERIPLTIFGDSVLEPEEVLVVNLFNPSQAVLATTQASITLWNDDTMTLPAGFGATTYATNLWLPTTMAFAPDGRLFVCEQEGKIQVYKNGVRQSFPFLDIPVETFDWAEAGLLGLAFDPGFITNHFVYTYYTRPWQCTSNCVTRNRISRFTESNGMALAGSEAVLFEMDDFSNAALHNGGGLHFGLDGKLYVGVGDNGSGANAQALTNLAGKVLRINPDGSIPSDNPFFFSASGNNRAIWALGLRNPFAFAFDAGTGQMRINDVGNQLWEEINDGHAGRNYGWPFAEGITGPVQYEKPTHFYGHGSGPGVGCAITGGAFCSSDKANFPNEYNGNYFFTDLCSGWIRHLKSDGTAADFADGGSLSTDLKFGPDGALYVLSRQTPSSRGFGLVYRISWKDPVRIESARYTGGGFELRATGRTNHTYILETSPDVSAWTAIATNSSQDDTSVFIDPTATNFSQRFYRLRE